MLGRGGGINKPHTFGGIALASSTTCSQPTTAPDRPAGVMSSRMGAKIVFGRSQHIHMAELRRPPGGLTVHQAGEVRRGGTRGALRRDGAGIIDVLIRFSSVASRRGIFGGHPVP